MIATVYYELEDETELEITGDVTPGEKQTWDCPGEPPLAEIYEILVDGKPWAGELCERQQAIVEEMLIEQADDDCGDALVEAAIGSGGYRMGSIRW